MNITARNKIATSDKAILLSIFALSLLVRLIYNHYRFWLAGDSSSYLDIAKNLAINHTFAFTGENGDLILTAFRPLLYPLFIAFFWSGDQPPYNAILFTQAVLGTLTVCLTFLIARRFLGSKPSLIAALLLTFAPLTIHLTATVLTETLFTFLVTSAMYFWGEKRNVVAGVLFGLASLVRPIIFPFLALILLFSVFQPLKNQFRKNLIMIAVSVLVAAPWMIRNTLLFDKITLTQSSGYGTNLLFGSIETPLWGDDIWSWIMKLPTTQPNPELNEVEQDRERLQLAISRISENPIGWLRARSKQYPRLFFDSGDYLIGSRNKAIGSALKEGDYLVVGVKIGFVLGWLLFFALCVVGYISAFNRFGFLPHVLLFPLFLAVIHLPMWIETRYNLVAAPLLCIIAVLGLETIYRYSFGAERRKLESI